MEMAEFYSAEFLSSDEFYKMFDAETYIDTPIHGRSEEHIGNNTPNLPLDLPVKAAVT